MKKIIILFMSFLMMVCFFIGCSKMEYNAVILKEGFTFHQSWVESNYTQGSYQSEYNNELPGSRTFIIDNQETLDEIFAEFKEMDFEKEMVVVYCYTTIYVREQKLEKVSFEKGVLSVEFDVVRGKIGAGDATAPQTRTCVLCLDKLETTEVNIAYNGQ